MYLVFGLAQGDADGWWAIQHKLRRTQLPLLSNFLVTSDVIPTDSESSPTVTVNPLAPPPRSRVTPLYYLPIILTPAQEAFLAKRKEEVCDTFASFGSRRR